MSTLLTEFGTLLGLVSVSLLAGVGLGVSLTARGFHLDFSIAVISGAVVCLLVAALIEQLMLADEPR